MPYIDARTNSSRALLRQTSSLALLADPAQADLSNREIARRAGWIDRCLDDEIIL
jgi:hypothetical protein